MNTTAAAAQANVTVATIRTWCRNRVITATKQAGRWIIDTASLAHRIAIGARRKATTMTPDYTALAAEAAELVARFTPPPGHRPTDRPGGLRDRNSGKRQARSDAQVAVSRFRLAATVNDPTTTDDERTQAREQIHFYIEQGHLPGVGDDFDARAEGYRLAVEALEIARQSAARVKP